MGKIAKLIKKITINIPDGHEYYCGEYKDGQAEYVDNIGETVPS